MDVVWAKERIGANAYRPVIPPMLLPDFRRFQKSGLDDLKARVRADVAWVQERVGAKMSRRARVSCCRWGAEQIAEVASRYLTR